MDNDRTYDPPEEPKRAIKESVGIAPRDPPPATHSHVSAFIGASRLRTADIGNDWHWSHDEHRQR